MRLRALGVLDRVDQGNLVAAGRGDRPELVERGDRGAGDLEQILVQLVLADAELGGDLLLARGAAALRLELADRPLDVARPCPHRAGTQSIARSSSMIEPLMRAIA